MSSLSEIDHKRSNYRLLGLVGQGQFGRVYCAIHRQKGRLVALKNLEHTRFPTHKFLRELRFLLSLQHPNIVTCYALEHTRTGRYLVMDYCEGGTLRGLLDSEWRLGLAESLKLIAHILAGLDHAHSRNIVHCDIKPENILLTVQPIGWLARISDFGIARLSQDLSDHQESGNTGSPAYMAPERFYGQYSHSSDLYSVGIMLFELLAGYRPFSGTPAELMSAHLNSPLKLPDSIPEIWKPILITSLQKLAGRRFRSAADMLASLQAASASAGVSLEPVPPIHLSTPLQPASTAQLPDWIASHPEALAHPIHHLVIANHVPQKASQSALEATQEYFPPCLYYADGPHVGLQTSQATTQISPLLTADRPQLPPPLTQLPDPVHKLLLRPQGCFAVTSRAVYLLQSGTNGCPSLMAQPVAQQEFPCLVDIEAQGEWLAMVTVPETGVGSLSFQHLAGVRSPVSLPRQPVRISSKNQYRHLLQLFVLDTRHIVLVSAFQGDTPPAHKRRGMINAGTVFEIFARRGQRLGTLTASLCVQQIQPTQTPYRLMVTDACNPYGFGLIDLKPYRVSRFELDIAPHLMTTTEWGYLIVDEQGTILLLDRYGQPIDRLVGPRHPTAIAVLNPREILVATREGTQGRLYTLNLEAAGVDLAF